MSILWFVEIILITLFAMAISFSCYKYFKLGKNKTKFDITNYKRKLLKLKLKLDKIENNHIENNLKYYKIKMCKLDPNIVHFKTYYFQQKLMCKLANNIEDIQSKISQKIYIKNLKNKCKKILKFKTNFTLKNTLKINNKYSQISILKNSIVFSNFFIYVNGRPVKNYTIAYRDKDVIFYRKTKQYIIKITKSGVDKNIINIKYLSISQEEKYSPTYISFVGYNMSGCDVSSVLDYNKKLIKHYKYSVPNILHFKVTNVYKINAMQNIKYDLNFRVFDYNLSTMHNNYCKNTKMLNYKQLNINKDKIIFNINVFDLFRVKHNKYNLLKLKRLFGLRLLGCSKTKTVFKNDEDFFNFDTIKNIKVDSNNKYLDNLVNGYLPPKIINEYTNNFDFKPLNNRLYIYKKIDYNYISVIKYFLAKKQYILLYNYLLLQVYGIGVFEDKILFYNFNNLLRKFTINYANHFMIITNENGIRKVLYNGIVYVNPKVIFLDKSHIKIDKSNLV